MRNALVRLLTVLIGIQPALLYAQEGQPQTAATSNPQAAGGAAKTPGVDYDLLSASLARLRRELAEQPPSTSFTPLKLNFYVEVVAEAPPIQFFTPQDFAAGGVVPWAPPTHRDMLDVMTPQEFRSPVMPIGSMLLLGIKQLLQWEAEKAKRQREAEKRQREEEQRKKLIFGAPVPHPK